MLPGINTTKTENINLRDILKGTYKFSSLSLGRLVVYTWLRHCSHQKDGLGRQNPSEKLTNFLLLWKNHINSITSSSLCYVFLLLSFRNPSKQHIFHLFSLPVWKKIQLQLGSICKSCQAKHRNVFCRYIHFPWCFPYLNLCNVYTFIQIFQGC